MHYEINVSKSGTHYFATHERSILTQAEAKRMYRDFLKRFPEREGFAVHVTQVNVTGLDVTEDL